MAKNSMRKVSAQMNFPDLEKEILEFWKQERIFEKTLEKDSPKGEFVFYDGPPFATGLPHYGHLLPGVLKDLFPRYKTMQGYHVSRAWGWDCHGLPIENLVEKELGFKSKKDIEAYGIDKFNEACRSKVLQFADDWKVYMDRFGRFADMEHPYKTMDPEYMESVWAGFKKLWDKHLIYESYRTMHICPRCETTLSQQEVSEGYKDVKDLSVTAKFELIDEPGTYLLAWTTTPWTLPGNVALAVNRDVEYAEVSFEGSSYILASALVEKVFVDKEYKTEKIFSGSELIGKSYQAPFEYYQKQTNLENYENGWKVYHADFVTTEMGTGIAHEAPAFGEDDMNLYHQYDLPWVQHVNLDGTVKTEVTEFAGAQVKPIDDPQAFDVAIIKSLAQKGLLFHKEKYEHSYPHCWRCDTPLLNYATSSWFVAVSERKDELLKNAEGINWSPEHIKAGRFGKWLEGARDWSISRQRFWATPIPIWRCECGEVVVIGSKQELEKKSGKKIQDLHKHFVDVLAIPCEKCDKTMKRIPDVLDTWFDSGSMPYASKHFLFEEALPENFPANFIAEGIDQTRAWFYYLHVLGNALFEQNAFQNVVVNGTVLAEDGKKMSKKLQNYPDLMGVLDTYGADALRLYLLSSPGVSAENLYFSEKDLASITKNTFRMLWNSYSFFTTYATIDNWQPKKRGRASENLLDRWILSELGLLIEEMTNTLENYQPAQSARLITPFIDNLSNWYIRRSRKRFWKNENDEDKGDAYQTLYTVLIELSKLMAPFTPFIADEIYRNLTGEESVHLAEWPEALNFNSELSSQMEITREVINKGLEWRSEAKIKVRQPLEYVSGPVIGEDFQEIVKDELNVKEYRQKESEVVELNAEITPELKLEGQAREIIRAIQEGRKKARFNVEDRISLGYQSMGDVFAVHQAEIAGETLAEGGISKGKLGDAEYTETVDIDGTSFTFWLKRSGTQSRSFLHKLWNTATTLLSSKSEK